MSGKREKLLRKQARREVERRLALAGGKIETRPRWWFRVYCWWAKRRGYSPERVRKMARRGIRREIVSE